MPYLNSDDDDTSAPFTGISTPPTYGGLISILTNGFKGVEQGQQTNYQRQMAQQQFAQRMAYQNGMLANSTARVGIGQQNADTNTGRLAEQQEHLADIQANFLAKNKAGARAAALRFYPNATPDQMASLDQQFSNTFPGEHLFPAVTPTPTNTNNSYVTDSGSLPNGSGPATGTGTGGAALPSASLLPVAPPSSVSGTPSGTPQRPYTYSPIQTPTPDPDDSQLVTPATPTQTATVSPFLTPYVKQITPVQQTKIDAAAAALALRTTAQSNKQGNTLTAEQQTFMRGVPAQIAASATMDSGTQNALGNNLNMQAAKLGLAPVVPHVPFAPSGQVRNIDGPPTPDMVAANPAALGAPLKSYPILNPAFNLNTQQVQQIAAANNLNATAAATPVKTAAQVTQEAANTNLTNQRASMVVPLAESTIKRNDTYDANSTQQVGIAQERASIAAGRAQVQNAAQTMKMGVTANGTPTDPYKVATQLLNLDKTISGATATVGRLTKPDKNGVPPVLTNEQQTALGDARQLAGDAAQQQVAIQNKYNMKRDPTGNPGWVQKTGNVNMNNVPAPTKSSQVNYTPDITPISPLPGNGATMSLGMGGGVSIPNGGTAPMTFPNLQTGRNYAPRNNAATPPNYTMRTPAPSSAPSGRLSRQQIDALTPAQKVAHLQKILSGNK